MSKTKILVFQMKELVYTGIFVGLGLLLIILLIVMFYPSGDEDTATETTTAEAAVYNPGIYNSQMQLGDTTLNLEIVVDESQIKSVSLVNLDESVTTMYPLVKPSLEFLEEELVAGTPIDDITVSEKSKYTQTMLIDGIKNALSKATVEQLIRALCSPDLLSTAHRRHHSACGGLPAATALQSPPWARREYRSA